MLIQLISYFVTHIVEKPDAITIELVNSGDKQIVEVRVAPQDLARVIGKEGRTFKALRALVHALEPHANKDIVVDVIK